MFVCLDLPKAEFLHRLPIHNGDSRRQRVAFDADVDEETGEINLTWDAVDSATGYTIYCDTEGGGRVPLTTVTTTAYTVSDYAFDTLSVAVIPGDDAVEFDAEVDGQTGEIALTWDASETAMGYTIYHDTGSGALEYLDSVTGLSYTVSGSLDYTAGSLVVTEIRSASEVAFVADVDEQTGDTVLTWGAVSAAVGYTVYHDAGDGALECLGSVTGLSYTVSGSLGYAAESLYVTVIGGDSGVEFGAAIDGEAGEIALTWDAVETAMGYTVYHDAAGGALDRMAGVTATSYTVSGYSTGSLSIAAIRGDNGIAFDAVTDGETGDITLSWDAVDWAAGYGIYQDNGDGTRDRLAVVTTTYYVVSGSLEYSVDSLFVTAVYGATETIRQGTDGSSGDAPTGVTMR